VLELLPLAVMVTSAPAGVPETTLRPAAPSCAAVVQLE
jgi:hypothetical protein